MFLSFAIALKVVSITNKMNGVRLSFVKSNGDSGGGSGRSKTTLVSTLKINIR